MPTDALTSPQAPLPVQKAWLLPPLRFQADAPPFQVLSVLPCAYAPLRWNIQPM